MITVNLGVDIEAYVGKNGTTTEEVADELEEQYSIVNFFVDTHWDDIAKNIGLVIANRFYGNADDESSPMDGIEHSFREMLDNEELNGTLGVPTGPALSQNRPSFIDTGLYRESFSAWVDE